MEALTELGTCQIYRPTHHSTPPHPLFSPPSSHTRASACVLALSHPLVPRFALPLSRLRFLSFHRVLLCILHPLVFSASLFRVLDLSLEFSHCLSRSIPLPRILTSSLAFLPSFSRFLVTSLTFSSSRASSLSASLFFSHVPQRRVLHCEAECPKGTTHARISFFKRC